MWYYNVPYKYHSTAVWYFVVFFFSVVFPMVFFSTTWVPQATLLQYHRTLCGTSLSLWYFLWYYAVPQEYHRNTTRYYCKGIESLWSYPLSHSSSSIPRVHFWKSSVPVVVIIKLAGVFVCSCICMFVCSFISIINDTFQGELAVLVNREFSIFTLT